MVTSKGLSGSLTRGHCRTPIQITATETDGSVWVSLRHVCDAVGIEIEPQRRKLNGKSWARVVMMTSTGIDGKSYEMLMIDRKTFVMWLATIDENKVNDAAD